MSEENPPLIKREPSLRPSPAIRVYPHTTVAECITEMRRRAVGSVVVVEPHTAPKAGSVVGMFTERDFLLKSALLGKWPYGERKVSEVMTSPAITLELGSLHLAPKVMLEKGFRHLPIVTDGKSPGDRVLVGMLSIRDLLKGYLDRVGDLKEAEELFEVFEKKQKAANRVGLIARNFRETLFVRQGLARQPKIQVQPLLGGMQNNVSTNPGSDGWSMLDESALSEWMAGRAVKGANRGAEAKSSVSSAEKASGSGSTNWQEEVLGLGALVVDLDGWPGKDWVQLLKGLAHLEGCPPVFVLFDPLAHLPSSADILIRLGRSSLFQVYSKPLNPLEFFWNLETALSKKSKPLPK